MLKSASAKYAWFLAFSGAGFSLSVGGSRFFNDAGLRHLVMANAAWVKLLHCTSIEAICFDHPGGDACQPESL